MISTRDKPIQRYQANVNISRCVKEGDWGDLPEAKQQVRRRLVRLARYMSSKRLNGRASARMARYMAEMMTARTRRSILLEPTPKKR